MTFYTDSETSFICEILLPSNKAWRMKNYFKLVEQQRALDASPMPAAWPEKLEEVASSSQSGPKRPRRSSIDSGLSLTSTISADTTWTVSDIAKAGCRLIIPPRCVSFDDEEEMRRVFSLIYDVFRYKSVLNQALVDAYFFIQYPQFQKQSNLVWLLFYDLYKRKFLPRDHHEEHVRSQLFEESGLLEADMLLWNLRVKLAASVSRLRIKNNALKLSQLLPLHLRDERVVALDEAPVTGWINTFKIEVEEVKNMVEKAGLSTRKNEKMNVHNYEFDKLCPKFMKCHPSQRSDLAQSDLVRKHSIILQDRAFCLGPAIMCNILQDLEVCGKVVQTHINSPRTTAYLANILMDNGKIESLIAFGAGERKEEYEAYLQELGVTNTMVHTERFVDISSESEILDNVVAILATPPNTYSGVVDPVDLVCSRGGDLSMLEVLTDTEIGGGSLERVNNIMEEQRQTLRMSMSRPQIQVVLYETHSIVPAENSEMVSRLVNEMNYNAKEKHAEEQGKPLALPSYLSSPKRDGAEFSPSGGGDSSLGATSIISVEIVEKDHERASTEADIAVPPCDLFELSPLPKNIPDAHVGVTIEKEGCYLAYLRRKEIVRLNAKYMINIAESRGLFGGEASTGKEGRKSGGRQFRKKPELQRSDSGSPPPVRPKSRRFKLEIDRIAAPTQASILRRSTERFSGSSNDSVIPCPRHQTHLQQEGSVTIGINPKVAAQVRRQDARRWWGETAKHILAFGFHIDAKDASDETERPSLKLMRSRPNGRIPFPISVTSLKFDTRQMLLQECSMSRYVADVTRIFPMDQYNSGTLLFSPRGLSRLNYMFSKTEKFDFIKRQKPVSLKEHEVILDQISKSISKKHKVTPKKVYTEKSMTSKSSYTSMSESLKSDRRRSPVNLSIIDVLYCNKGNVTRGTLMEPYAIQELTRKDSSSVRMEYEIPITNFRRKETSTHLERDETGRISEFEQSETDNLHRLHTDSVEKKLIEAGKLKSRSFSNVDNEKLVQVTKLDENPYINVPFMKEVRKKLKELVMKKKIQVKKRENVYKMKKNIVIDSKSSRECKEEERSKPKNENQLRKSRNVIDLKEEGNTLNKTLAETVLQASKNEFTSSENELRDGKFSKSTNICQISRITESMCRNDTPSLEKDSSSMLPAEATAHSISKHKYIYSKYKEKTENSKTYENSAEYNLKHTVSKEIENANFENLEDKVVDLKLVNNLVESGSEQSIYMEERKLYNSKKFTNKGNFKATKNSLAESASEFRKKKWEIIQKRLREIKHLNSKLDKIHENMNFRHMKVQHKLKKINKSLSKPKVCEEVDILEKKIIKIVIDEIYSETTNKSTSIENEKLYERTEEEIAVMLNNLKSLTSKKVEDIEKLMKTDSLTPKMEFLKPISENVTIRNLLDRLDVEKSKGSQKKRLLNLVSQLESIRSKTNEEKPPTINNARNKYILPFKTNREDLKTNEISKIKSVDTEVLTELCSSSGRNKSMKKRISKIGSQVGKKLCQKRGIIKRMGFGAAKTPKTANSGKISFEVSTKDALKPLQTNANQMFIEAKRRNQHKGIIKNDKIGKSGINKKIKKEPELTVGARSSMKRSEGRKNKISKIRCKSVEQRPRSTRAAPRNRTKSKTTKRHTSADSLKNVENINKKSMNVNKQGRFSAQNPRKMNIIIKKRKIPEIITTRKISNDRRNLHSSK